MRRRGAQEPLVSLGVTVDPTSLPFYFRSRRSRLRAAGIRSADTASRELVGATSLRVASSRARLDSVTVVAVVSLRAASIVVPEVGTGGGGLGEFPVTTADQLEASYRFCGEIARREARNFYYRVPAPASRAAGGRCAPSTPSCGTPTTWPTAHGSAAEKETALAAWRDDLDDALDGPPGRLAGPARPWPTRSGAGAIPREPAPRGDRRRRDGRRAAAVRRPSTTWPTTATASPRPSGFAAFTSGAFDSEGGRAERLAEACGIGPPADEHPPRRPRGRRATGGSICPEDDLARFGVDPRRPGAPTGPASRSARSARLRGAARLRLLRPRPRASSPLVDPVGRPVLLTIVGIYRALLDEIVRRDYDVLAAAGVGPRLAEGWPSRCDRCPRRFARGRSAAQSPASSPESESALDRGDGRWTTSPPPPHVVDRRRRARRPGRGLGAGRTAGLRITLLESRPRLGGRASSFTDPATGELVDNCQHVSMACCTNLADFCRRVGIADLFRREPAVVFLSPEGGSRGSRPGVCPAPFHLAGSFLRANYLTWSDKLRVAYGLACLRSEPGRPAGRVVRRLAAAARPERADDRPVLGDGPGLGAERAARTDGRRPRPQGLPRRLPAATATGYQMEIPLVAAGRALRHAAGDLAPRPRGRGPADDRRPARRRATTRATSARA